MQKFNSNPTYKQLDLFRAPEVKKVEEKENVNKRHDFIVVNGIIRFFLNKKFYQLDGVQLYNFIKKNKISQFFENIQFHTVEYTYRVFLNKETIDRGKLRGNGDFEILETNLIPTPFKLKNVKPAIDFPFKEIEKFINKANSLV